MKYIVTTTLFLAFAATFTNCSKKIYFLSNIAERQVGNIIYLKSGTLELNNTIEIPSGIRLIGKNTIIKFSRNSPFPLIKIEGKRKIELSNIKFIGEPLINLSETNTIPKYNHSYIIEINNSEDILIDNCTFQNSFSTVIQISDSRNIKCINSNFTNIGVSTSGSGAYSYDAIFIGGYKKSELIKVANCTFENIGSLFPMGNKPWPNDGDGIHIQGVGEVNEIEIKYNVFKNCSARGVKIQTGDKIYIVDNQFINCWTSVNMAMAKNISNISIKNNIILNNKYAFGTDGYDSGSGFFVNGKSFFCVTNLTISNNMVDTCDHFFRTSGHSIASNATIANNNVQNIKTYFIDGRFLNSLINNNTIDKYCTIQDPSYNYALFIEPETQNLMVRENTFGKTKGSKQTIINSSNGSVTLINNNFFQIKE